MAKYLIDKIETYRVDNEDEAKKFVEKMKHGDGEVVKHSIERKERKQKGEVIDEWIRVTIKTHYNDERDPLDAYVEED